MGALDEVLESRGKELGPTDKTADEILASLSGIDGHLRAIGRSDLIKTKKENFRNSFQRIKDKSRESMQRGRSGDDPFRKLSNLQTPTSNNLEKPSGQQTSAASSMGPGSSENEEERISLRLGREKAGGGFRGHSAKLGKLIIEDEGLKMCDLVVAAAMGIWWQHYEH